MVKCVSVCHKKSSLPTSELSAAKWVARLALPAVGRIWPSDDDDTVDDMCGQHATKMLPGADNGWYRPEDSYVLENPSEDLTEPSRFEEVVSQTWNVCMLMIVKSQMPYNNQIVAEKPTLQNCAAPPRCWQP